MHREIITLQDPCTGDCCLRILHESGMEIRVAEMPAFSTAYAQLGVRFGSIHQQYRPAPDSPAEQFPAGIAHFMEHKMFEKPDGDVSCKFAALGALDNAFTDFDRTVYHFAAQRNFGEALGLLLDMVQQPYFTKENVDRERTIIRQELAEALDDPADFVFDALLGGLYSQVRLHPHTLGTPESLRQITAAQLRRCHALFYHPQNMILCCAGNITADAVLRAADAHLHAFPPPEAQCIPPTEPEAPAKTFLRAEMPVGKPMFAFGFKSPPVQRGTERLRQSLLATLTLDLLIGPAAPLCQHLLHEGLINDTFDTDCFAGDDWFAVYAEGESDDPQAVLDALLAEIERMERGGIDTALFAALKKAAYGDSIIGMNNPESVCTAMLDAFMWGCDSPYIRTALLAAITPEDIMECLRTRFRRDRICLSTIFDQKG